ETYESLDIEGEEPDYRQDIQDMELDSGEYDTVFCRNVLEHVEEPRKAVSEIARVLRDGGKAVISVPHLAYLHKEPEDYYRFTEHGIEEIASGTGLEVVEVREAGGLFSFMGYIFSTAVLGSTYHVPLLSRLAYYLNFLVQLSMVKADELTGNARFIPLNYVIVLRKSGEGL
ncbi:MAG: class I SAM-dependent methyltransferase, partial [Candidatus Nanohaloarchaea archaeon]